MVGFGFRASEPSPMAELIGKQITVDDYSIASSEKFGQAG
jgi:hypothetical protein